MTNAKNQKKYDQQSITKSIAKNGGELDKSSGPVKKKWSPHDIAWHVKPQTGLHRDTYEAFFNGYNLAITGQAGTGKTLIASYLGISEVLNPNTPQDHLIYVRSLVQTRDMGFLPGDLNEKSEPYEIPYIDIMTDLFERPTAYSNMKQKGIVNFFPTSFVRGSTWNNAVVVIDEAQNMTFHELDSVLTRIGRDSRVIVVGDKEGQIDLNSRKGDHSGFDAVFDIATSMTDDFATFTYGDDECCRSGFVKSWGIKKREYLNKPK